MLNVNSIVWLVVYLVIFTPVSLVYRLVSPDPLNLKRDPHSTTYWQKRRDNRFRPMTGRY